MAYTVTLPKIDEDTETAQISTIDVNVGDTVKEGQDLFTVETGKATNPIPSPVAGVITKILVAKSDEVAVGAPLLEIEAKGAVPAVEAASAPSSAPASSTPAPAAGKAIKFVQKFPRVGEEIDETKVTEIKVKVGDQVKKGQDLVEVEGAKGTEPIPAEVSGVVVNILVKEYEKIAVDAPFIEIETTDSASAPASTSQAPKPQAQSPSAASTQAPVKKSGDIVYAGPATRKYAREHGVDLSLVAGSQRGGRIDIEDVKKFLQQQAQTQAVSQAKVDPQYNISDGFGPARREKMSGIRKVISRRLSDAWARIPHVFQFEDIDVTHLMDLKDRYNKDFKAGGSSASPTNFLIKALAICLKEFPIFNTTLDEEKQELIYRGYYNIGVAVDTPKGLLVPVLKNVDQKTIFEIGKELRELAIKTRDGKAKAEDSQGGCITLSNLGGIGGTHFTPIVNPPQVAILGVGSSQVKPIYINGEFVPRHITQVTLSYDHRVIDGADGARFIARFKDIMENFERTLLGA